MFVQPTERLYEEPVTAARMQAAAAAALASAAAKARLLADAHQREMQRLVVCNTIILIFEDITT